MPHLLQACWTDPAEALLQYTMRSPSGRPWPYIQRKALDLAFVHGIQNLQKGGYVLAQHLNCRACGRVVSRNCTTMTGVSVQLQHGWLIWFTSQTNALLYNQHTFTLSDRAMHEGTISLATSDQIQKMLFASTEHQTGITMPSTCTEVQR